MRKDIPKEDIKFFYKNRFLGSCEPDYIGCEKLHELLKTDKEAATQVLKYMNSLGDPVFPVSDEEWSTPETNVDNVDIDELYYTFMEELDYVYDMYQNDDMYSFSVGGDDPLLDFEIFEGDVVWDNVIEGSTKKRVVKAGYGNYSPEFWGEVRKRAPEGYLYIFKHGVGPGTIPNDVKVVKWKDLPNYYTAVWLDRFLDDDELKQYDIPSETEINRYLDRIGYCKKDGDVVPCDDVEACGDIKATTNTSNIVNTIYSVMMNYEYGYDPDMTDIDSMLQELTAKGVHVDTSNEFKKAWVSAHNKAERKTWGGSGDSMRYDDLTPRELEAIENYDTEYWEYAKDHPLNIKPISSSKDTKYFANMSNVSSSDDINWEQIAKSGTPISIAPAIRKELADESILDYYVNEYPTDELGSELKDISFADVWDALNSHGKDIYDVIGVGDSVVRERIFDRLSEITNLDYDAIYYLWLYR